MYMTCIYPPHICGHASIQYQCLHILHTIIRSECVCVIVWLCVCGCVIVCVCVLCVCTHETTQCHVCRFGKSLHVPFDYHQILFSLTVMHLTMSTSLHLHFITRDAPIGLIVRECAIIIINMSVTRNIFTGSLQSTDAQDDSNNYVGRELLRSLVHCVDLRMLLLAFANTQALD